MTAGDALLGRYAGAMVQVFGTPQLVLASGHGCWVTDVDGRRYLDLLSGIAVNALGHGHPALVQAVTKQAESAIHVSNFFTSEPAIALAERILAVAAAPEGSGVFFANSGAEATEAAIKLSRRTGRSRIVALEGSFHGRTTGALALTHKAAYREPFEPLIPGVALRALGRRRRAARRGRRQTAARLPRADPGRGRRARPPPTTCGRPASSRRPHGALLVLDEIQTGIGRTGDWFAHQAAGVVPDAIDSRQGPRRRRARSARSSTFGPEVTTLLARGPARHDLRRQPARRARPGSPSSTRSSATTCSSTCAASERCSTTSRPTAWPAPAEGACCVRSSWTAYLLPRSWQRLATRASSSTR